MLTTDAGSPRADRRLREALHHEERPAGVRVHQPRPDLGRGVEQPAAVAGRRGVDERVRPADRLGRVDQREAVLDAGEIGLARSDLGPARRELARRRLALSRVAPGEHQPRAALGDQPPGDGEAEPLGAAGDDGTGAGVPRRRGHAASAILGLRLRPGDVGDHVLAVGLLLAEVGADPAAAEHHDPVDQVEHLPHVVADQDQRLALLLQRADDVLDLRGLLHPERRRRLVHDRELRVEGGGAGDRHALPLAAGHVADGVARGSGSSPPSSSGPASVASRMPL